MYFEIVVITLLVLLLIVEYKRYQVARRENESAKPSTNGSDVQSTYSPNLANQLIEYIEEEKSKLRRYNTYSMTLMDFSVNLDGDEVAKKLKTFLRKSDRVFTHKNKVYIFFPFTRYDTALKSKIENRVLTHLQSEFEKEVKFITTKFYGYKYDPELRDEEFPLIS